MSNLRQEATESNHNAITKLHLPKSNWFQAAEGFKARIGQAKD